MLEVEAMWFRDQLLRLHWGLSSLFELKTGHVICYLFSNGTTNRQNVLGIVESPSTPFHPTD